MSEFTGTTSPVNDTRTAPWPEPVSTPWQLPWPTGCIARYWTVAGATVDVIDKGKDVSWRYDVACTGCPWKNAFGKLDGDEAHRQAQAHAERCRALPRPAQ